MGKDHIFAKISQRAFDLSREDLRTLRGKYRNIELDIPNSLIQKMNRDDLVKCLLRSQFDQDDLKRYIEQTQIWSECERFCS